MPILNYTTEVKVEKTAGEIQSILVKHNAKSIRLDYEGGKVSSISFLVGTPFGEQGFKLPANTSGVYAVLLNQLPGWKRSEEETWSETGKKRVANNHEQAERTAWRILKDWVEAQMAIIDASMVRMEEVFLPYLITSGGQTLYSMMVNNQMQLPEGKP